MGLYIDYTTLDDYLLSNFSNQRYIRESVDRAKNILKTEIQSQMGTSINFMDEIIPEGLEGFKYGNYSEIHFLRMFASRISGYSLDEAYEIPDIHYFLGERKEELIESGEEDVDDIGDEEAIEEDLEIDWGWKIKLDSIIQLSKTKIEPFPYFNTVCFPDAEGIYIPIEFNKPIHIEGIAIGSSIKLAHELTSIENTWIDVFSNTDASKTELKELLHYIGNLINRLQAPCLKSVKGGFSFYFC